MSDLHYHKLTHKAGLFCRRTEWSVSTEWNTAVSAASSSFIADDTSARGTRVVCSIDGATWKPCTKANESASILDDVA